MFDIANKTKQKCPISNRVFLKIKNEILGAKYELSLVFVGDQKSKSLNNKFRNKNYIPNILSFPYQKTEGEIFLNLKQIIKESKKTEMSKTNYIKYIFIHGCLHLKGMKHGKVMEVQEKKHLKKFL